MCTFLKMTMVLIFKFENEERRSEVYSRWFSKKQMLNVDQGNSPKLGTRAEINWRSFIILEDKYFCLWGIEIGVGKVIFSAFFYRMALFVLIKIFYFPYKPFSNDRNFLKTVFDNMFKQWSARTALMMDFK